jgi:hypothetical protein
MTVQEIALMALVVMGAVGAGPIACLVIYAIKLMIAGRRKLEAEANRTQTDPEPLSAKLALTKEMMEFIRYLVGHIAMLRHQERLGNKKLEATTRANDADLIREVAKEVEAAIIDKIDLEAFAVNRRFLEFYIIKTARTMVEKLTTEATDRVLDLF